MALGTPEYKLPYPLPLILEGFFFLWASSYSNRSTGFGEILGARAASSLARTYAGLGRRLSLTLHEFCEYDNPTEAKMD